MECFRANDWQLTRRIPQASLVIVFTCAFDRYAELKSRRLLAAAVKKKRPDARLVACGCFSGIMEESLAKDFDLITVPPRELGERLLDQFEKTPGKEVSIPLVSSGHVNRARNTFSLVDRVRGTLATGLEAYDKAVTRISGLRQIRLFAKSRRSGEATLVIARGCPGDCTYCAIRPAIGPLRSAPLKELAVRLEDGFKQGHSDFVIIAGDTGAYGRDIGLTIVDLLRVIFSHAELLRLTIQDLNPQWFNEYADTLIPVLTDNAERISMIWLPLQSGSRKVLQRMRRQYDPEVFLENCLRLRERAPTVAIGTHILIGFPGESEEDFDQTLEFCRQARFSDIFVFKYTDRPGTQAADMPDKVPEREKRRRVARLRSVFPTTVR